MSTRFKRRALWIHFSVFALCCCALFANLGAVAADDELHLRQQFKKNIKPFLDAYCASCHGQERPEAKLNLGVFSSFQDAAAAHKTWQIIMERLEAGEMPPEEADEQPSAAHRRDVLNWIQAVRRHEAVKNAGDPGLVLARRLSNAEYNYTIRDLTGVDIRPTRSFPVDPANEAGFDNSGESLSMSPALLQKYLGAAREVADHLVLTPNGIAFAPHPVVTNTDRDKYCVKRIVNFYRRQPTDYADYFLAAWLAKSQNAASVTSVHLADAAAQQGVSLKYLSRIWRVLTGDKQDVGPLAHLQRMWRKLPNDAKKVDEAQDGCLAMRDYIVRIRRQLEPQIRNLAVGEVHKGSQTLVLWKNRQYAAHRQRCNHDALKPANASTPDDELTGLQIPVGPLKQARYLSAFDQFCKVFPDAFYIAERGRDYLGTPREEQEKGRLLSAGFHSMMGYFRDDRPLYDLVLSTSEQQELDLLWKELDFVTSAPMRQYAGFVWFERTDSRFMRDPEFDFARAEDKSVTSTAMIQRLSKVYLEKAKRSNGSEVAIQAIEDYFLNVNHQIRWVERTRQAAEPVQLERMLTLAARAYRRPLSTAERNDLLQFYQSLREQDQLSHEEAIQDVLVSVLMSPYFTYRVDLASDGDGRRSLSNVELASRLSYFLWSSMPDARLLDLAARGTLHRPEVLLAETRRMLRDDRIEGLALEFGGNWLDFRRFQDHKSVDRERFPEFTDELRQAMFEEPIRFFVDLAKRNGSILEFLDADHTFVNPVLAEHYGIAFEADADARSWQRVDNARALGRGGLLPMSVFLTSNSPGLRTSPVKRGYWVVRRLLGERIPPPPPNVPELPGDESKLGDESLREMLARHREHKSCAGCHNRFDAIGLVFEGYGPVGKQRIKDFGGHSVDMAAVFPDGSRGTGLDGLRNYLREQRQSEFLENYCRKLLSYSLGRTLLLSDDPLILEMQKKFVSEDYRFGGIIESIVTSSQFLTKRGSDSLAKD